MCFRKTVFWTLFLFLGLSAATYTQAITVSGHATADCSGPVKGVEVHLNSNNWGCYAKSDTTDAAGYYEFTDVPACELGGRLRVYRPSGTRLVSPSSMSLDLQSDATFDIELECIVGTVYGTISSGCDGPMPGIPVRLETLDGTTLQTAYSGANGDFSFAGISSAEMLTLRIEKPEGYDGPDRWNFWVSGPSRRHDFNLLCPKTVIYFQDFEEGEAGWSKIEETYVVYGDYWRPDSDGEREFASCGERYPVDCWANTEGSGYGNNWDQRLDKEVDLPAGSQMTLTHWYDTESYGDYCYVEASTDGGTTFEEMASFTGNSYGFVTSIVGLPPGHVTLRLRFDSDGGWSDQDGGYISDGAWKIDGILIPGILDDGFNGSLDGWSPPPTVGNGLATYRLQANAPCVAGNGGACYDNMGRSWVAYDEGTGVMPCNPPWLVALGQQIRVGIESPKISTLSDASGYVMAFCMYVQNQGLASGRWFRFEVVSTVPSGGAGSDSCEVTKSNNHIYYFGGTQSGWLGMQPGATATTTDITGLIDGDAGSFRVRLIYIDETGFYSLPPYHAPEQCEEEFESPAPYFDNFLIAARGTSHPGVDLPYDLQCPAGWVTSAGPTSVGVAGSVTAVDPPGPLAGVPVDLITAAGEVFMTVTDGNGNYVIESIPFSTQPGEVSIQIPLGYAAVEPADGHTVVELDADQTVDFTLARTNPAGPSAGMGYWKHQANVYLDGRGNALESEEDMTTNYPLALFEHFHENDLNAIAIEGVTFVYSEGVAVPLSLETVRNTLTVNHGGTMIDRAKQHYLTLLLNIASGRLGTFSVICEDEETTVSQALQEIADLILDGDDSNDETAKNIAETLNRGELVPEGVIRDLWQTIPYRVNPPVVVQVRSYDFALDDPSPNPFTLSTRLRFEMPRAGTASVRIYDSQGRLVRDLAGGQREPGEHFLSWDGLDDGGKVLPSGVYYLRLDADGSKAVRSVILTR